VLAIRWLGAAGYGEFVIAEAVVFALGVVALYGNHLACFALAEQTPPAHPRSLLVEGGRVILTLWSAEAVLVLAALHLLPPAPVLPWTTVAAGAAAVLGMALYRYVSELLRISVSPELANYFSGRGTGFVSSLVFCMLVVLSGLRDGGLRDAGMLLFCHAVAQWIGAGIGLAFLWPALRREAEPGEWLSARATRAALWLRGRSILVTQGLQLVMGNADVWVLGAFASPQVVGVYGLAKRFANWLLVPAGMIGMAGLKHAVAEFIRAGRVSEGFVREFSGAVRVSWFGTAAIVALAALVPSSWVVHFGGGDAGGSQVFFVALGVGQLLRLAFGNGGLILTAAGFERDNLVAFFWGSVLSLLMAAALVPGFSAWGAVAAFSCGSACASFLVSRACRRRMGFDCDLLRAWRAS
jgi:O-antigen/teichoic acid export membrane protein